MYTLEERKLAAWSKATPVVGYDPALVCQDVYGWYIQWSDYGDRNCDYGWEIDHHQPTVFGGGDDVANLRALHWRNNASLGALIANIRG